MLKQVFPVIYQGVCYMVDPSYLRRSSQKFQDIIQPYINIDNEIKHVHLKIKYDKFTQRTVNNFLKICQNLPTDIKDSEFCEICEISLMFQANQIYEKSIAFIHNNIDNKFSIPLEKFQDDQFLQIECEESASDHHVFNLSDFDLDNSYEYTQINDASCSENDEDDIVRTNRNQSVCYQIKIEKQFMKCRRFTFSTGDRLLFTAKQKIHQIFIGKGNEVHIQDQNVRKSAIITQNRNGYNVIKTDDQDIKIRYLRTNPNDFKKSFSLKLSFLHENSRVYWIPKLIKNDEKLNGIYNHHPMQSKKNILLQNFAKNTTFIIRKMSKNVYEAECHSSLSPLIAFSIAISQIVGPYLL